MADKEQLPQAAVSPPTVTFDMLRDRIEAVKTVLCPNATHAEIGVFVQTCASAQLNPFLGDIHWIPGKGKRAGRARVSRQGLQKLLERTGRYRGMESEAVYAGDEFAFSYLDGVGIVNHTPHWELRTATELPIGAWAKLTMKGYSHPLVTYVPWQRAAGDLKSEGGHDTVWAQYPDKMIRKAAEYDVAVRAIGDNTFTSAVYEMTVEELDEQVAVVSERAEADEARIENARATAGAAEAATRQQLIERILAIERDLSDANWDNWDQPKRRLGSRMKHATVSDLTKASMPDLQTYWARLDEHMEALSEAIKSGAQMPTGVIDESA